MVFSVEYFDGQPYEPLNLDKEQQGFVAGPFQVAPSHAGIAADNIVKEAKAQEAQKELEKVGLEKEEMKKCFYILNTSAYCNPATAIHLVPLTHRIEIAWSRYSNTSLDAYLT